MRIEPGIDHRSRFAVRLVARGRRGDLPRGAAAILEVHRDLVAVIFVAYGEASALELAPPGLQHRTTAGSERVVRQLVHPGRCRLVARKRDERDLTAARQ